MSIIDQHDEVTIRVQTFGDFHQLEWEVATEPNVTSERIEDYLDITGPFSQVLIVVWDWFHADDDDEISIMVEILHSMTRS
jgi:hypothetical protein